MNTPQRKKNDMNGWILTGIIALFLLITIFAGRFFKSENKLNILIENNQTISILFGIYNSSEIVETLVVLMYNPGTNRVSGVYFLPNTYLSFTKNNRSTFMTISESLSSGIHKDEIKNGVGRLLGIKINYYIFMKDDNFIKFIDLINGTTIHTEEISYPEEHIYYFNGDMKLDGDKALEYISLKIPQENEYEVLNRTDNVIKNMLFLKKGFALPANEKIISENIYHLFSTNLTINDILIIYKHLLKKYDEGVTDFSRSFLTSIVYCDKDVKDNKSIYLPKQSGNWIRSQINDTIDKLTREVFNDTGSKITVQLLNGTEIVGFANRTRIYLESFGFKVVEMGNAEHQSYDKSIVQIKRSEEKALKLAELIRCKIIESNDSGVTNFDYDATLILGYDFDGRLVK